MTHPEPPRYPRPANQPEVPGPTAGLSPWLEERLYDQRIVLLQGPLSDAAASGAAAALMSLDTLSADPVRLHVASGDGSLSAAFALVDAIDSVRAPVHATVTAQVGGAVLAVLAAAGRRDAYPHARVHLAEPRAATVAGTAEEVTAAAGQYLRDLEELVLRLVEATGQPRSRIEDDLAAGRVMSAAEALEYGLIQEIVGRQK